MKSEWNLQDAKAKLSELVDRAQAGQEQIILRRGEPAAVLVSLDRYRALSPQPSLVSFLLHSPVRGLDLEIPPRDEMYEPRVDFSE